MRELSREQRQAGVAEAFASLRLAGRAITDAARRDADDYVEGRRTLDEIITGVVARPARRSSD